MAGSNGQLRHRSAHKRQGGASARGAYLDLPPRVLKCDANLPCEKFSKDHILLNGRRTVSSNGKGAKLGRLRVGLLIAPLCWSPVFAVVAAVITSPPPAFMSDMDPATWIGMAAVLGIAYCYIVTLAAGLPAHVLLQRAGRTSLWAYGISWFAAATLLWAIAVVMAFAPDGLDFSFSYLAQNVIQRPYVPLSFGTTSSVIGATFWYIVRPDRRSSACPCQGLARDLSDVKQKQ